MNINYEHIWSLATGGIMSDSSRELALTELKELISFYNKNKTNLVADFALYDWVGLISYRAQGTLLTCLRGGDNPDCDELKVYIRFVRHVVLKPATKDATKSFMRREPLPIEIYGNLAVQIDKSPLHLISHIMNAMRVIWEYHPDIETSKEAELAYKALVNYLHLSIETKEDFDRRIMDDRPVGIKR